jgi:hypothetical protein
MTEKICNTCDKTKNISEYSIRNNMKNTYHNRCKECTNNYAKEYREQNQNIIKQKQNEWYDTKGKIWKKEYDNTNKEHTNARDRERYKNDQQFRMKKILRTRFNKTVTGKKISNSILVYLGVSLEYFLEWIEYQFDENMNWNNQGTYWDIDHVTPCSNFNFENDDEIKICFNWKNIRPCEKIENYKKNNKIVESLINDHKAKVELYISLHPVPN